MMKKVNYLLLLMFATVLLTTSCEEDVVTPEKINGVNDGLMTLAQLDGQWNFESYNYGDIIWDMESVIPSTSYYYGIDGGFHDWYFDTSTMIATRVGGNYPYILDKIGNVITISDNTTIINKFTIISYTPTTLQFKYEDEGAALFKFKGGIYTYIR